MSFLKRLLPFIGKSDQEKLEDALKPWATDLYNHVADRAVALSKDNGLNMEPSFDLHFELAVFWLSAAQAHIKAKCSQNQAVLLNQALWNVTFEGFDYSLRDRGVLDVRLGARMKKLLPHAHGRRNVYVSAIETDNDAAMKDAIIRNILDGNADLSDSRVDLLFQSLDDIAKLELVTQPPVQLLPAE
ncbi:ubiquinol-cytochrome C chaperone family protein [Magnetococcus sp. PR-3]|uniref:ubiquinol-cytochrome C chaperone family protein n=1 Tax=Magnetococcus sp. PR-3 TaxID=3120355 RepID=UPI002FCE3863